MFESNPENFLNFFCMEIFIKQRQQLGLPVLFGFASCGSRPMRLCNSLIINILRRDPAISQIFWHGDSHQEKLAFGTACFDWVCQLQLLSNQIARFFYHQYLWKESSDILVFLNDVSFQGMLLPETINFCWVCSVVPFVQSDYSIL